MIPSPSFLLPVAALTALNAPAPFPQPTSSPEPSASAPVAADELRAALVFGDVDGDGLADALALGPKGELRLLLNTGADRFEDITDASGLSANEGATCAVFFDADLDGDQDVFLGSGSTRVWLNLGNASFEPASSGIEHDLVDVAVETVDSNEDGRADLVVRTEAGDLLYANAGRGRFTRVELPGFGAAELDGVAMFDPLSDVDGAAREAARGAEQNQTPARRRLSRWRAAHAASGAGGGFTGVGPTGAPGTDTAESGGSFGVGVQCFPRVRDDATGLCLRASSAPTLGMLHPMTTNLNVSGAGNVGIGTVTPGAKLDVVGGAVVRGLLEIDSPADWISMSDWDFAGDTSTFSINETNVAARMTIKDGGNVGIGTMAPTSKLHVQGPAFGASFNVYDFNDGDPGMQLVAGFNGATGLGGQARFTGAGASFIDIGQRPNGDFVVETGDTPRLVVDGSGEVGIGTTAPTQSLDVKGHALVEGPVFAAFGDVAHLYLGDTANRITNLYGTGLQLASYPGDDSDLTIRSGTGNVGIGTDTPAAKLSVNGDTQLDGRTEITGLNDITGRALLFLNSNNGGLPQYAALDFQHNGTSVWGLGKDNSNDFYLDKAGARQLTVKNSTGNVGIGTASPSTNLHVAAASGLGTFRLAGPSGTRQEFRQGSQGWDVYAGTTDYAISRSGIDFPFLVSFGTGNIEIRNRLGIKTATPAFDLEVNGTAGKPGGGSWSVSSDARLKKNVQALEGSLDTLLALRGVSYEYKDPEAIHELAGTRVGFIAQDVEKVIPDWVEEVDGYKRLTIRGFEALAVEGMRELAAENEALRARVERLEAVEVEVAALKAALEALLAKH